MKRSSIATKEADSEPESNTTRAKQASTTAQVPATPPSTTLSTAPAVGLSSRNKLGARAAAKKAIELVNETVGSRRKSERRATGTEQLSETPKQETRSRSSRASTSRIEEPVSTEATPVRRGRRATESTSAKKTASTQRGRASTATKERKTKRRSTTLVKEESTVESDEEEEVSIETPTPSSKSKLVERNIRKRKRGEDRDVEVEQKPLESAEEKVKIEPEIVVKDIPSSTNDDEELSRMSPAKRLKVEDIIDQMPKVESDEHGDDTVEEPIAPNLRMMDEMDVDVQPHDFASSSTVKMDDQQYFEQVNEPIIKHDLREPPVYAPVMPPHTQYASPYRIAPPSTPQYMHSSDYGVGVRNVYDVPMAQDLRGYDAYQYENSFSDMPDDDGFVPHSYLSTLPQPSSVISQPIDTSGLRFRPTASTSRELRRVTDSFQQQEQEYAEQPASFGMARACCMLLLTVLVIGAIVGILFLAPLTAYDTDSIKLHVKEHIEHSLQKQRGLYVCGYSESDLIPIEDLKADVKNTFSSVTDNDIDEVLRELNEADFGCENYTLTGDSIHYCFSRSGEIKPTFCIIQEWILDYLHIVEEYLVENAAIIAPICLAVICCAIVFVIRRRRLAEKENINKLVDKIRARLSAQRREANNSSAITPYIAEDHLKDKLINVRDAKQLALWEKAKEVIKADPCIQIYTRTVNGSQLLTWQWIGVDE